MAVWFTVITTVCHTMLAIVPMCVQCWGPLSRWTSLADSDATGDWCEHGEAMDGWTRCLKEDYCRIWHSWAVSHRICIGIISYDYVCCRWYEAASPLCDHGDGSMEVTFPFSLKQVSMEATEPGWNFTFSYGCIWFGLIKGCEPASADETTTFLF